MAGKPKAASIRTIAQKLGIDRNKLGDVLAGCSDLPRERCLELKAKALELGYVEPHPNQHHNSGLTQAKADAIVDGILTNAPLAQIAAKTGFSEQTAFKYIRGVKVPTDYPDNEEGWRSDVVGFLEIALWKGSKRLAETSIEKVDDRALGVTIAIAVDKLAVLKGQPTSFSVNVHQTISHRDVLDEIRGHKKAIDVEFSTNPEVVPDGQ